MIQGFFYPDSCLAVSPSNHCSRMFSLLVGGCKWFCPICLIYLVHLIERKSLHFGEKIKMRCVLINITVKHNLVFLNSGCLPRVGVSDQGGVPCDLSHHAFDVTCILSLLTETDHQCSCLYSAGHVTLQSMLGYTPHPLCGQNSWHTPMKTMEIFLNVFAVKGLEPATSCVRDQDATTVPARHMWETGSLNWAQFMLHWFIRFPEFTEFSEVLPHLGKTPLPSGNCGWQ